MMKRAFIFIFGSTLALLASLALPAGPVRANPRPLPFSYTAETLAPQALEIEQIVDLTPVRTVDRVGDPRTIPRATLTTEFEYGLTGSLELGLYIVLADEPIVGSEGNLRFDGLKQRLRWRVSEPGAWPVDVTLYGEMAQLRNEFELEGKVILQRRLGPVRLLTNLWLEREWYYSGRREWVLHPTFGGAYEFGSNFSLGLEGWYLQEFPDVDDAPPGADRYNNGPHVFLGPTVFAQGGGHGWLSFGLYTRVTDLARDGRVGDYYGRLWIRLMLGIGL
jgi:hypothetical protein